MVNGIENENVSYAFAILIGLVIACVLLLGKGADGTGAATSEGVQATALVASIFVACALGILLLL